METLVLYYNKNMEPCDKKDAYFVKIYKGKYDMDIYLSKTVRKDENESLPSKS
jgi:hypothetical protein